ncbi:hypothetical protein [Algibacter sp. R77976]|uniref:hypothetical protein n=1 Tax=Algibacter sp. R77976 TaxID=3093873 RepID=UPI0037C971A4
MKKYIMLSLLVFVMSSCKEETKNQNIENETIAVSNKEIVAKPKTDKTGTFLCKINGEDWAYTKASGIVSRHKKTKKRTAIITFTKQLDKGKESVQLFYDGETNKLEKVTAILKTPKKGGGRMGAMYQLLNEGGKRLPESEISGTIDLSKPTASGRAQVTKMKIRFDEGNLEDASMSEVTFTPINFSGIGYSDSEKLFGTKNN